MTEIAAVAPKITNKAEVELNLLDLLTAFDRILAVHKIDPESPEAVDLYKTMLRVGRANTVPWKDRVEQCLLDHSFSASFTNAPEAVYTTKVPPVQKHEKSLRKVSDTDLRAPLMNLTNKSMSPVVGISHRYSREEIFMEPPAHSQTRIELPKLEISKLLDSHDSTKSNFQTTVPQPKKVVMQPPTLQPPRPHQSLRVAALEAKLETLKKAPAERESVVAIAVEDKEASNELIATSYNVGIFSNGNSHKTNNQIEKKGVVKSMEWMDDK